MAREGKKLELYEILAAKRAKGKQVPGFEHKEVKPAADTENIPGEARRETPAPRGMIIDDAVSAEFYPEPEAPEPEISARRAPERAAPAKAPPPEPEPRPRSPREVVFALDTAFIFFTVVLALVGSSYFLGYKRGQEEKPAGLAGVGDIEVSEPDRLSLRQLGSTPRGTLRPAEQDYTLILRTEPASDDLPERLELELAEAVARGRQAGATNAQGFIFRTAGNDPRFVLAVGLGSSANDAELARLLKIYNQMEGITLSREPRPYIGCRIAPVKELGATVY